MRRANITALALSLSLAPFAASRGQALRRTTIDSFTTSNRVSAVLPVFNRQRIYYVLQPDTLVLYDIATKHSTQIGVGQWGGLAVSRRGDLLTFIRPAPDTRTRYIWTLPLDTATGRTTAPARRVSMIPGLSPGISPDSRWIAFAADSDFRRLVVIPANGGQERELVHATGALSDVIWSPDGQQIYFSVNSADGSRGAGVRRVAVSGGTPVPIDTMNVDLVALSPDGSRIMMEHLDNSDNFARDPNGRLLPTNAVDTVFKDLGGATLNRWLTPTQILDVSSIRPNSVRAYAIGGGQQREILPPSANLRLVKWSPDGTHFAGTQNGRTAERLMIVAADGSRPRSILLPTTSADYIGWSPDGRSIAVIAAEPWRILFVDVATGTVRTAPSTGADGASVPRWMPDSRHLRYLSSVQIDGKWSTNAVRETSAMGPDRVVQEQPRSTNIQYSIFVSDTTVLARKDSTTYLVSLVSGKSTPIYQKTSGKESVSPNGDVLVIWSRSGPPPVPGRGGRVDAEVITLAGKHVATVTFTRIGGNRVSDRFLFTPDQTSLIGTGRDANGDCCVVYQGFLDGRPTRVIADARSSTGAPGLSLSPDGKTLLFTAGGPWTTVFTSIDASAALRGAGKK